MTYYRFLAEFKEIITNDYNKKIRPMPSRNPKAYAILEWVHQIIGNILRTFKAQDIVPDDKNPWDCILINTIFAVRATVHTTTQYTFAQIIIGRNTILNQCHNLDWDAEKKRKQDLINKGIKQKNHNHINTRTNKKTMFYFKITENQN